MKIKSVLLFSSLFLIIILSGCNTRREAEVLDKPDTEATSVVIPTATRLPTVTPAPTATATLPPPTPLPEPTLIATPTEDGEINLNIDIGTGPGLYLSEELGEPGETLLVEGRGFEPSMLVTFHWSAPGGPLGPKTTEVMADEEGAFSISLKVPPSTSWPGGSAEPEEFIQLRAKSDYWSDTEYFWANFRYVERFSPGSSLVLLYENETYNYSISLPNGWSWEWTDDDVSNVRFLGLAGGSGFARVFSGPVSAAIPAVMGAEAAGQSFSQETGSLGSSPATRVVTTNGLVVLFAEKGGATFAISFTDSAGNPYNTILSSVVLR